MQEKPFTIKKFLAFIICTLTLGALLLVAANYNPVIDLDNPELVKIIRKKINKPSGYLYRTDILSIIHLDASNSNLKSLDGIQRLRRLTSLNIENNHISDVAPLGELKMLTRLNLSNNTIGCLYEAGFNELISLPLRRLQINNFPQHLEPDNPRITDISLIGHLTALERLELRGHLVDDLTPLARLRNLRHLNLRENKLSCILPLSSLHALIYLNLHSNDSVKSLAPIAHLTNIETLILRNVPIGSDIRYLENLTRLIRLNLRNCNIYDTEVLAKLMAQGALQDDWENNRMAEVDIRDNAFPETDFDPYGPIRPYWNRIFHAKRGVLPATVSSIEPPKFSHRGGFHPESFDLVLSHPDPEVTIYYTLDGSIPDTANINGTTYLYQNQYQWHAWQKPGELLSNTYQTQLYNQPIKIVDRSPEPDKLTQISTTFHRDPARFPGYFPSSPVHKGTVVRAIAFKNGNIPSQISTNTYFVGENPYTLPIISLAIQEDQLFDYKYGIYVAGVDYSKWRKKNTNSLLPNIAVNRGNYQRRGSSWERTLNIEYYPIIKSYTTINREVLIRIHGGFSRTLPSKSLRLYTSSNTNESSTLNFPEINDIDFERFILRNSGNDFLYTYFKDPFIQNLANGLNFSTQAYQPGIVFINGEYWGLLNLRERYDRYYITNKYEIDPDSIEYLTANAIIKEGTNIHYKSMIDFIKNNQISDKINFEYVQCMMDMDSFIDYFITNIFINNKDWPGGNIDYWRKNKTTDCADELAFNDGRWRWMLFDTDFGFIDYSTNTLNIATNPNSKGWPNPEWSIFLLRELLKNENFKIQFINRMSDLLNTYFLQDRIIDMIDDMKSVLKPEIPAHIHRWSSPKSMDDWFANVDHMKVFATQRPAFQRQHLKDFFELEREVLVTLDINNHQNGYITLNTIDIQPSTPGVSETPYPWSGIYFHSMPVTITANPKPGYKFVKWVETGYIKPSISFTLTDNINFTAIFERE
ncbi:CotH kinase family protein [Alkalitalea saponilacus]|uniref:Fn3 associated n=1 Tax=Alkalitalea saponilacus TaxID=889453 RepID=A0A1T5GZX2_9BACT|nr:CotH kinase family protein [Alkalitalea saponilacus]ASB50964.1 hypothetical protein CDL62_18330 [Alkalitalea saponilacus]SKC13881.1 Fn3 associated [Alkalitalea saponilacus]